MKYFIATFGCQMNKSDSERIVQFLEENTYQKTLNIVDLVLLRINEDCHTISLLKTALPLFNHDDDFYRLI